MKKLICLFSAMSLALGAFTLSSCNPANGLGIDPGDTPSAKGTWKDSGDTATYTVVVSAYGLTTTTVYTFQFDSDDECTGCSIKVTYPNEALAQEVWDGLSTEEKATASKSGRTITYSGDETYIGYERSFIKSVMQSADDAY